MASPSQILLITITVIVMIVLIHSYWRKEGLAIERSCHLEISGTKVEPSSDERSFARRQSMAWWILLVCIFAIILTL